MYNAQATLLPTWIHSILMYAMIFVTIGYYFIKWNICITKFTIWYLLFGILCLFSATFNIESDLMILYPITVSFVLSYCYIQNINSHSKIEAIANMYIVSALFMTFQIWYSGQLNYIYIGSNSGNERLGEAITGNANIFSALFMYSGVFASWCCVYSKSVKSKIIYLLLLAIVLVIMVISGGRKTIVAVVSTLALFYYLKGDVKIRKRLIYNAIIALALVALIAFAVLNIPLLYEYVGKRFEGLFHLFMGKGAEVSGDNMRSRIFVLAYEGWKQCPLFGHGIDSFKEYNQSVTGHYYYAHNNYVELLYDVGVVGFIAYYWMYVYIYRRLKLLPVTLYKYRVLGYGLLLELFVFDFGGVSYYLVGNITLLAIAYCCTLLKSQAR